MADCLSADIRLSDAAHLDGSLHAHLHAALLQAVGQCEAVNDRREHAHMIRPGPLHPVAAVLDAAPEVAAADNNADLHARLHTLLDHVADTADHIKIQAPVGVAGQRLAADLQQDAPVFRLVHGIPLLIFQMSLFLFYNNSAELTTAISQFHRLFSFFLPGGGYLLSKCTETALQIWEY